MTLNTLIQQWIADSDITGTSAKNYLSWIRPFQIYISNRGITIKEVTKPVIIAYKHFLQEYLTDKTVNCYITAIRMFYSWMELNDYAENITTGIRLVRIKQTYRKHPLTMDQVITLLNSCEDDTIGRRNRLIIELMITTGIRSIEVSRLLHTDHKGTRIMIQGKGRNTKDAFMELTYDMSTMLSKSAINNESPYIFHTITGHQLTAKYISQLINTQLHKAGINSKHITTHSLRHTAAILAMERFNNDIVKVKEFMRHGSVKTTEIYLQSITANNDGNKDVIQEISKMINSALKQSQTGNNDASK